MNKVSGRVSTVRRLVLAGAATLSLIGVSALSQSAQAMPAAALALTAPEATTIQYRDDGLYRHGSYRHHRRHVYSPHRGAGLYSCAPNERATRLSRKSCGGTNRYQRFNY